MPMLYLGTLFGVQIGTILNEAMLAISLAAVLLFVAVKTMQKAIETYKKENVQKLKEASKSLEMQSLVPIDSSPS